jgi:hypothetical protein
VIGSNGQSTKAVQQGGAGNLNTRRVLHDDARSLHIVLKIGLLRSEPPQESRCTGRDWKVGGSDSLHNAVIAETARRQLLGRQDLDVRARSLPNLFDYRPCPAEVNDKQLISAALV